MATQFSMQADLRGSNAFAPQFTDTSYSASLAVTTDTSVTVPTNGSVGGGKTQTANVWLAIFGYTAAEDVWVAINTAASAPAGASFAATASELNPAARVVKSGDVIHFYTAAANVVANVLFYALS